MEGWLFIGLVLLCGLFSIGSHSWSNIPLLMCLVLFSLWLLALLSGSRSLEGLSFRRSHAERIFANEPVTVALYLANTSRLPAAGLVITEKLELEQVAAGAPGLPAAELAQPDKSARPAPRLAAQGASFVTAVSGRGEERARYSLLVRRRGIYRFTETALETAFPLGFFNTTATRYLPGRLIVYPRLGEIEGLFLRELEVAFRYMRQSRPSRAEEDYRGLREYRAGDSPRWIHWRSSARLQKLLVKEFEEPQAKRVLLLLDSNLQRLGPQRYATYEWAVSFAGTLARDLARRGYEVECAALQPPDRLARVVISRERRNLDALLEMLAGLRRDDTRTLADMAAALERRSLHHVYVLVVGLGSLRLKPALGWLHTMDNVVRVFNARGEEFRRIFRLPRAGSARDQFTEDELLLGAGDEEEIPEDAAQPVASSQ